ncbi:MAG: exodeoxyribonuclease VII large subunit [Hallerella porci]|uniref:Exodeoxyribonuclease 7 large subunit n=1 Tax=Hallerella porci TaxID=1945871 RepID=A0ABX5LNW5_9BACT|nr:MULTISPECIES: exodeoxyribonuclease VII large subunit [Hallerella]MCI5600776.1 exodeoxyribonuclease VII large subunit [Hallerella sp.]MDY3920906.1 exodeoxyribonuclease VII large subunit [Hallerella porci]PWL04117.1 exodeoxyribonuclease VII large subunit [Hallerella porci]
MEKTFPVSKYLTAVKKLLTTQIPPVWVNGVITQITERGRMVYLSIAEFAEGDVKPIAKIDLYLFAGEFAQMQARIAELPIPFTIKEQLKVNFLIEADFYIGSGKFQCHVTNIDPNFTLGELALTRQAILERLEKEGLLTRNKMQPFAAIPLKVGLITGETTAALKDFTTTLAHSGFAFEVIPAYAKMQGNETERTVLEALGKLRQIPDLDVICIVRGGGSKTDLNYFDSEALCRAIAISPVPILTGIGHQIDESLVDKVAFRSCITPTDCAKFLIARVEDSARHLREKILQIANATQQKLSTSKSKLFRTETNLSVFFEKRIASEKQKLFALAHNIARVPERIFSREREKWNRNLDGLRFGSQKIIALQKANFEIVEAKVKANDPKRILARGYTYATAKNGLIKKATDVQSGDEFTIHFADGNVNCTVK